MSDITICLRKTSSNFAGPDFEMYPHAIGFGQFCAQNPGSFQEGVVA